MIEKAKPIAAHMLECEPPTTSSSPMARSRSGARPDEGKTIADCALAVFAAHDLPDGVEAKLDAEAVYDPENFSFPHGTHLCAVEVDTETGTAKIRKYVAVDDIGRVINPLIVEGQVHGGIAQGIAQALFEEAVYDDDGQHADRHVRRLHAAVARPTCRTSSPTGPRRPRTGHPLGVKGVGEAGTIASTPAVVNAVVDALRPRGVHDIAMPCTPERVWRAANQGSVGAQGVGQ